MRIFITICFLLIGLSACINTGLSNRPFTASVAEYYWYGMNNGQEYALVVDNDSTNAGIWFEGLFIIRDKDTLYVRGFEKGNLPTRLIHLRDSMDVSRPYTGEIERKPMHASTLFSYNLENNDTSVVAFRARGRRDSVLLNYLPNNLQLIQKARLPDGSIGW